MASAHVGLGDAHDALHGFVHPLTGIDHILAMVTVGLLAAHLGGRAIWAVPLSFVSMMLVGGIIGMSGIELPYSEVGIGTSIVALGAALALSVRLPVALAMAMAGFFAIFHGFAHGAEMPEDASGLSFAIGFVAATSLLHVAGISVGVGLARFTRALNDQALRFGGGAIALAGIAILAGVI
jgi:urease accessory protein